MSEIVVLGGRGFLGRALVRALEGEGRTAVVLGSREADLRAPGAGAALEARVPAGATLVFAAALTREHGDDRAAYDANLAMARAAAEVAARRAARVLYLSSTAVYGHRRTDLAVTEDTPPDPDSWYARAKLDAEAVLLGAGRSGLALRVCHVYGPGDPHLAYGPARFVDELRRERTATLFGDGEELRDHVYVEDAGRLIARLAAGTVTGVLNLATGRSVGFRDIAERLVRLAPFPSQIRSVPRRVPLVHQAFDTARLRTAAPGAEFTDLDEGLRRCWTPAEGPDILGRALPEAE